MCIRDRVHRRRHRLGRDGHLMVALIAGHKACKDALGGVRVRLLHHHPPEAPFQRRVLLDAPAVLLLSGGADDLYLAPGQQRFEDAGGVDGSLRRARAHDDMDLVNEQDGAAVLVYFVQQVFEPFLKVAPVLGARHQTGHIQTQDALVQQLGRGAARRDGLRQRLGQGGLAHARLPHKTGVIFLAAAEYLDDPLQFLFPAEHRVQPAFRRHLGQVAAVLLGGLAAAGGSGKPRLQRKHQLAGELPALPGGFAQLHAPLRQPPAGGTVGVFQDLSLIHI